MPIHDQIVLYILSRNAGCVLGFASLLLALIYLLQILLDLNPHYYSRVIRKERLSIRAFNWIVFGVIFLLSTELIALRDLLTWRAMARLSLFFLILSELAYQIMVMIPETKERAKRWHNGRK